MKNAVVLSLHRWRKDWWIWRRQTVGDSNLSSQKLAKMTPGWPDAGVWKWAKWRAPTNYQLQASNNRDNHWWFPLAPCPLDHPQPRNLPSDSIMATKCQWPQLPNRFVHVQLTPYSHSWNCIDHFQHEKAISFSLLECPKQKDRENLHQLSR